MLWRGLTVLILSLWLASPAEADRRVALVIGNSSYGAAGLLTNPKNDSSLVADTLTGDGFEVTLAQDADRAAMLKALREFNDRADQADWALVYYAGHGVEIGGVNYLLPTDVALRNDRDAEDEAVSLDRVLKTVENARKLRLVILDSCRNNPFAATMKRLVRERSLDRGLSPPEPRAGVLVVYAAAAGAVAQDGAGEHSPFAAALARRLAEPGLETRRLFDVVTADVLDATGGRQRPYLYGSNPSREELYFKPPAGGSPLPATVAGEAWGVLKTSADVETLKAFRDRLPTGDPLRAEVEARIMDVSARPHVTALSVAPPAAVAAKPVGPTDCDRLAAHSDDLDLPRGYPSIAFKNINPRAAIPACQEALLAAPDSRRVHYQLGRALDADKDYLRAKAEYELAAAANSAIALSNIGTLYYYGHGVPKDVAKAREWTEKGAAGGNPAAMTKLGILHYKGEGGPRDYGKAREWFEKSAAAGNGPAMTYLGLMSEEGLGAPKDAAKARAWYYKAAAAGDDHAREALAHLDRTNR